MALQFLSKEDNGEFYFRPSSQGNDHLTLTWKFYEENIVHIDIRELDKPIGANIGSKLQISDEFYENLQEIVERYITPCNRSIREILQHPKFLKCIGDEDLKKALDQEKTEDNARIPYRFTISKKYPQYVIMGYVPKKELVREFIKVKPRGYFFHHQYHYPFQNMINWFKQEFRSRDYQRYVRKAQSPQQVVGRQAPKAGANENPSNVAMRSGGMDIQQDSGWQGGGYKQENDGGNRSQSKYGDSKGAGYGRGNRPPRDNSRERGSGGGGWGADSQSNVKDERERRNGGGGGGWGNDDGGGGGGGNNWGGGGDANISSPQSDRGGGRGRGGGDRSDRGGGERGPMKCFNCQGEGHMSRECPEPRKPRDGGDRPPMKCYNCQGEGHGARDCTEPRKPREDGGGGGRPPMKCYNCQGEGHMSRECPEPRKPREDGGGRPPMKCYNCQGEGHGSRDCQEPRKPRDNNDDGGGYKRQRRDDNGGGDGGWNKNKNDNDGGDGWGQTTNHQANGGDQWGAQGNESQTQGGWGEKKQSQPETAGGWGENKKESGGGGGDDWGNKNSQNSNDKNGGGGWG